MIHNSIELKASVRALHRLEKLFEWTMKNTPADDLMKEQLRDLMRPIRRDIRKYLAAKAAA